MTVGTLVEATLWRVVYLCAAEQEGQTIQKTTLLLTADPSGADVFETLKATPIKGDRVVSLVAAERLHDSVRGLALRSGDASTWPEPGIAGAALLEITGRQAGVEGELRRELLQLRHLLRNVNELRQHCERIGHEPWELQAVFLQARNCETFAPKQGSEATP